MKKITSKEPIKFRVNGTPGGGGTVLNIDEQGCIADDRDAAVVAERLGSNVKITNISAKEAVEEAKKMKPENVNQTVLDEIDEKEAEESGTTEKNEDGESQSGENSDEGNEDKSLSDMSRQELNKVATDMGIDPKQYSNAEKLRDAITNKSN